MNSRFVVGSGNRSIQPVLQPIYGCEGEIRHKLTEMAEQQNNERRVAGRSEITPTLIFRTEKGTIGHLLTTLKYHLLTIYEPDAVAAMMATLSMTHLPQKRIIVAISTEHELGSLVLREIYARMQAHGKGAITTPVASYSVEIFPLSEMTRCDALAAHYRFKEALRYENERLSWPWPV